MRISRLQITNFRSIKHLDFDISQVCCLVGPNNAGKSNILSAIRRVLAWDWVSVRSFDEEDVYAHDPNADVSVQVSFEPGIPYAKFVHADPVSIKTLSFKYTRYKAGEERGNRRLEQSCLDESGELTTVLAKAPKKGEKHQYQPLFNIPSDVRE